MCKGPRTIICWVSEWENWGENWPSFMPSKIILANTIPLVIILNFFSFVSVTLMSSRISVSTRLRNLKRKCGNCCNIKGLANWLMCFITILVFSSKDWKPKSSKKSKPLVQQDIQQQWKPEITGLLSTVALSYSIEIKCFEGLSVMV